MIKFDLGWMLRNAYQKVEDEKVLRTLDFNPEDAVD